MSFEDEIRAACTDAVDQALARGGVSRPAPYPISVSVNEAARLLSVGPDTVRALLASGRLRSMDLGDTRRTVIPTVALFELDPGHDTEATVHVLTTDPPDPPDVEQHRRTG